ncbi:MAG TPA: YggS family pyridoxal phosphate enzyme [Acidimicrobiales bacterium]|nr:YggS family pyridoxal phosphate enzyme [Acidimicrobiales bacterium]
MTGPFDRSGFGRRLEEVHRRIAAAGDPAAVRIVAVTKGFGADAVRAALGAGLTEIGENYADELVAKAREVTAGPGIAGQGAVWHFLGAVQRNKVPRLVPVVAWWQAVSRIEEGRAIAARRPGAKVLVQVDVVGRPGRRGCPPERVRELVAGLLGEGLDVAGLMAVGPPGPPEDARPGFALVSSLADALDLPVRSMGMSDDLEVALSEGSTMVRLGRALFGDRAPVRAIHQPGKTGTTL